MDMSILSELEELQRCLEESDPEETLPHQTSKPSIVTTGDSGSDLENLLQSEYMSLAGISEDAKSAEEVKSKAKKGVGSNNPEEPENSDDIVKQIFGDEHPKVGTAEQQPAKEISASESIVVTGDTKRQSEVQLAKDGINLEPGERKFAELESNLETKDSAVIASDAKHCEVTATDAKNSDVAGTNISVGEVTDLISSIVPASNFEDRVSPAVSYCENSLIVVSDGKKSSAIIPVVNEKDSEFTIDDSVKSLAAVSNDKNSSAPVVDAKDSSVSGVIDPVEEIANATITDTESELQSNSDACPGSPFLKIEQVFSVTPQVHRDGTVGDMLSGEGELGEQKDKGLSPKDLLIKKRKIQMDTPSHFKTKAQLSRLSSSKRRKLYTEPSEESGLVPVSSGTSSPEACLKLQSSDQTKPKARQRLSTQFSRKMKADLNDMAPSPKKIKLTEDKSTETFPKSSDVGSIKSEIIPIISQMETNTNIMGTVNPDIIPSNLKMEKIILPLGVDQQFIEQEVERFGKELLKARVVLKRLKIPIPEHLSGSKKEEKTSVNLQNTLAKVSKDIQETLNKPTPVDVVPQKGKRGKSKQTNKKPSRKESKPLVKKSKERKVKHNIGKVRHNMVRTPSVSVRIRPKRKRILTKKILASKLQAQARARKTVSRAKNKTATVIKANDTNLKSILVKKDKKSIVKKKVVFKDEMIDVKKLKKLNAMKTASEKKDVPSVKTVPLKKTVPVKNPMPERKTTSVALENKIYLEQEKTPNKKTVPVKKTMPERKTTSVALENKICPEQDKTPNKKTVPVKNPMPERKTSIVALENKIYPEQEKTTNKKTVSKKANTAHEHKNLAVQESAKVNVEKKSVTCNSDKNINATGDEPKVQVKNKRGRKPLPKSTGNFVKLSPAGIPLGRPRKTATSCPARNAGVNMGSRLKESKANVKSTATDKGKEEDSGNDPGEDEWIVEMLLDDEVEVLAMSDATRVSSSDEKPNSSQADRNDSVPECDSSTDKKVRTGQPKDNINNNNSTESPKTIERTSRKVCISKNVGVQVERKTDITLERKMTEMKKAIGDLERIADRSMLRLKAEERQVIYLSNKLRTYENDKHYKVLRRILKDAAPGPNQNADAVFIIDLMLSYCPNDGENDQESNETAGTSSRTPQTGGGGK